jgi:hypothetical protein
MNKTNSHIDIDLKELMLSVDATIDALNLICASIDDKAFVAQLIVDSTGRMMDAKIALHELIKVGPAK